AGPSMSGICQSSSRAAARLPLTSQSIRAGPPPKVTERYPASVRLAEMVSRNRPSSSTTATSGESAASGIANPHETAVGGFVTVSHTVYLILQYVEIVACGVEVKIGGQDAVSLGKFQHPGRGGFPFGHRCAEPVDQVRPVQPGH